MSTIIGSARIDEHGKATGGTAGDQKQTSTPDTKGEVSMQNFYVSSKGWNIVRAKDFSVAKTMSELMKDACNNPNIGYSQSDRYGIHKAGIYSKTPTNCDCSSLVREIVWEALNHDPGDFNTSNEVSVLVNTGSFVSMPFTKESDLMAGDILVTKTKGHTVIVVSADANTGTPTSHIPMNYLNSHIYIVCVDDLNVREKTASDSAIPNGKITRKLNVGDRITCIKAIKIKEAIWIYMGINSNNKEEWCCADTGSKAYVK